jgi:hypothetical protein
LSSLHPAKRTGGDLRFRAGKHRWPGKFETAQEFDDAIAQSSFAAHYGRGDGLRSRRKIAADGCEIAGASGAVLTQQV